MQGGLHAVQPSRGRSGPQGGTGEPAARSVKTQAEPGGCSGSSSRLLDREQGFLVASLHTSPRPPRPPLPRDETNAGFSNPFHRLLFPLHSPAVTPHLCHQLRSQITRFLRILPKEGSPCEPPRPRLLLCGAWNVGLSPCSAPTESARGQQELYAAPKHGKSVPRRLGYRTEMNP